MRLGRYELIARLAQGGMGEIFLARLEGAAGFAKLYAIKRILPQFAADPRFRKMLIGEAQIASKMAHSNICQVYELGESDGQLYIVIEGVTLLPLLRARQRQAKPLDFGFVSAVLLQLCDALLRARAARSRGQLARRHPSRSRSRTCSSASGTAKVLDFGIAKVKGKYAYLAPEQLRGEELSRRVDVFALGIVAYEMIALRRLFQRQTDYLVLEQPITVIRRYRADAPGPLVDVIMKALSRARWTRSSPTRSHRAGRGRTSRSASSCRGCSEARSGRASAPSRRRSNKTVPRAARRSRSVTP